MSLMFVLPAVVALSGSLKTPAAEPRSFAELNRITAAAEAAAGDSKLDMPVLGDSKLDMPVLGDSKLDMPVLDAVLF